jgi:hypothetical protein
MLDISATINCVKQLVTDLAENKKKAIINDKTLSQSVFAAIRD